MKRLARGLHSKKLPPRLLAVLRKGLVLDDGCVLLREFADSNSHLRSGERGAREWLINHLHVDDYVPRAERRDGKCLLAVGLSFEKQLISLLRRNREFGPFRVVTSIDTVGRESNLTSCTVRFYRKRKGEAVMANHLEGYKLEAIQVTDIR